MASWRFDVKINTASSFCCPKKLTPQSKLGWSGAISSIRGVSCDWANPVTVSI